MFGNKLFNVKYVILPDTNTYETVKTLCLHRNCTAGENIQLTYVSEVNSSEWKANSDRNRKYW